MLTNKDGMAQIHALCHQYKAHIGRNMPPEQYASEPFSQNTDDICENKILVINLLLSSTNTEKVLDILCSIHPNYTRTIRENRSNWYLFWTKAFFVLMTFPLSLPILMLWSWLKRGSINFLISDGGILVKEILTICEQVDPPDDEDNPIQPIPSVMQNLHHISNQSPDNDIRNDSMFKTNPPAEYSASAAIPSQDVEGNPMQLIPSLSKKIPEKPSSSSDIELRRNVMLRARPLVEYSPAAVVPSESNEIQQRLNNDPWSDDFTEGIQEINTRLPSLLDGLLSLRVETWLRTDTGLPLITSYRIRSPEDSPPDTFSIDMKCIFRWTAQPKIRITLLAFNSFDIPLDYQVTPGQGRKVAPKLSLADQLYDLRPAFFKPSFDALLAQEKEVDGVTKKERILLQAHDMANTDLQRVLALEALINVYGHYLVYLEDEALTTSDPLYKDIMIPRALAKFNGYIKQLPENYRSLVPSGIKLNTQLQAIYSLIKTQRIDEAWVLFEAIPILTSFIKESFPNLMAMRYQLSAIFEISRHLEMLGERRPGMYTLGNSTFIPEHEIITNALAKFSRARDLIAPFNPLLKDRLEAGSVAPLQHLLQVGKHAAQQTSYADRVARRNVEVRINRNCFIQGIDPSHRIPHEDMDADEEPQIVAVMSLLP